MAQISIINDYLVVLLCYNTIHIYLYIILYMCDTMLLSLGRRGYHPQTRSSRKIFHHSSVWGRSTKRLRKLRKIDPTSPLVGKTSALAQPSLPPSLSVRTHHKFYKIRSFLHQKVLTFASEDPSPVVRKMSALDKPPPPWLRTSFMDGSFVYYLPNVYVSFIFSQITSLPPALPLNFGLNWSVNPTHITLTLCSKSGVAGQSLPDPVRVRIKNNSLASLIYDVVWPGHYITITPQKGRIEPEYESILSYLG